MTAAGEDEQQPVSSRVGARNAKAEGSNHNEAYKAASVEFVRGANEPGRMRGDHSLDE